jgi:hypothetical protein
MVRGEERRGERRGGERRGEERRGEERKKGREEEITSKRRYSIKIKGS